MKIIWYLGSGVVGIRFVMLLLCLFNADIFSAEIGYATVNIGSLYAFLVMGIALVLAVLFNVLVDRIGYYGEYTVKDKKIVSLATSALVIEIALMIVSNIRNISVEGFVNVHIYAMVYVMIFIVMLALSYYVCKNDYYCKLAKSRNEKITTKPYAKPASVIMLVIVVIEIFVARGAML